jgi:hypothetical protein
MENGLFEIYQSRDIYFTLDMWSVVSHGMRKQTDKSRDNNESEKKEEHGETQF